MGLLAACTDDEPKQAAPPDPDVALRDAAVAREQALLQAYDVVLAAQPGLRAQLQPYRDDHAEHLAALQPHPPSTSPTGSPSTVRTRAELASAERAAGDAHAAAGLRASPGLAGLLASLAASESAHAAVL